MSRPPSFFRRYVRPLIPVPKRRTLRRWFPSYWQRNAVGLMRERGISLVLDVGANEGQYAEGLRAAGYGGRIVSFEPLRDIRQLAAVKAERDPSWEVAPAVALDRRKGERIINVLEDHSLTSFLAPAGSGRRAGFGVARQEVVACDTLDNAAAPYLREEDQVLIKLDVQGFEWQVLEGAQAVLSRADAIHIELSLLPNYVGEAYYLDVLAYLRKFGFALAFPAPIKARLVRGRWDQFDGFLLRSEWLENWDPTEGWKGP